MEAEETLVEDLRTQVNTLKSKLLFEQNENEKMDMQLQSALDDAVRVEELSEGKISVLQQKLRELEEEKRLLQMILATEKKAKRKLQAELKTERVTFKTMYEDSLGEMNSLIRINKILREENERMRERRNNEVDPNFLTPDSNKASQRTIQASQSNQQISPMPVSLLVTDTLDAIHAITRSGGFS